MRTAPERYDLSNEQLQGRDGGVLTCPPGSQKFRTLPDRNARCLIVSRLVGVETREPDRARHLHRLDAVDVDAADAAVRAQHELEGEGELRPLRRRRSKQRVRRIMVVT